MKGVVKLSATAFLRPFCTWVKRAESNSRSDFSYFLYFVKVLNLTHDSLKYKTSLFKTCRNPDKALPVLSNVMSPFYLAPFTIGHMIEKLPMAQ